MPLRLFIQPYVTQTIVRREVIGWGPLKEFNIPLPLPFDMLLSKPAQNRGPVRDSRQAGDVLVNLPDTRPEWEALKTAMEKAQSDTE
jgi:hypothetical protein